MSTTRTAFCVVPPLLMTNIWNCSVFPISAWPETGEISVFCTVSPGTPGAVGTVAVSLETSVGSLGSTYVTCRNEPAGAVRVPLLAVGVPFVTATTPPVNTPVLGPVSHRVMVSVSPLTRLVIVTGTESSALVFKFWSASVTRTKTVSFVR